MRYLVTGGAGFIGSHLVHALLAKGHHVRILENFVGGTRDRCPAAAEVVEGDVRTYGDALAACRGMDGVFHVAALPRVTFSLEHPLEAHAANINGTVNILEAARQANVRRVVYSASSSAYGDQTAMPLHEDLRPAPKSPYGLQKYVGEEYARMYAMCFGLETVSLRYFNVYGPGMRAEGAYATVIAMFLRQRLAGQPLTITGDGTQTRDFTHVRDVVRANLLAMEAPTVGKGEVINIGAGTNWSVNAVAAAIGGPVVHIPQRLEPHDTRADHRRAEELLGWRPEIPFDVGIRELIDAEISTAAAGSPTDDRASISLN